MDICGCEVEGKDLEQANRFSDKGVALRPLGIGRRSMQADQKLRNTDSRSGQFLVEVVDQVPRRQTSALLTNKDGRVD